MPVIPVDYGQVNAIFTGSAVPRGAEITFGFQNVANLDADANAALFGGDLETLLMPHLASALTLDRVRCKLGPNATGPDGEFISGTVGGDGGQPLPPNTAVLVRKSSTGGGRKNRGRMYVPGLTESETAGGGVVDPAWIASAQPDLDTFVANAIAGDVPIVILHHDATAPTQVTAFQIEGTMATQRRRIRKV